MSFLFEDDSALEELLNQQLDGRSKKHQVRPSTSIGPRSGAQLPSRPSTGNQTNDPGSSSVRPRSMASWLDQKRDEPLDVPTSLEGSRPVVNTQVMMAPNLLSKLNETSLQEMSKQALIRLVVDDIVPTIQTSNSGTNDSLMHVELLRLRDELEEERTRHDDTRKRHIDEVSLLESRWNSVTAKLENQIGSSDRQLTEMRESHRREIQQLRDLNKQELDRITQNFKTRLEEEKLKHKEELKRKEELNRLEMETKLQVNCDITRLGGVFNEWHELIESTIRNLESQFKSVEGLLGKQSHEIRQSNVQLAHKTQTLAEYYEQLDSRSNKLENLSNELGTLLPRISIAHETNQSNSVSLEQSLGLLTARLEELQKQEILLKCSKDEAIKEKEALRESQFEIGLDKNRLAYKEERLDELLKSNGTLEARLMSQQYEQSQKAIKLDELSVSIELKSSDVSNELKKLEEVRRVVEEKETNLNREIVDMKEQRKLNKSQMSKINKESARLKDLKSRVQKELDQMRRVEKSLVCSLCLDRLFQGEKTNLESAALDYLPTDMSQQLYNEQIQLTAEKRYTKLLENQCPTG